MPSKIPISTRTRTLWSVSEIFWAFKYVCSSKPHRKMGKSHDIYVESKIQKTREMSWNLHVMYSFRGFSDISIHKLTQQQSILSTFWCIFCVFYDILFTILISKTEYITDFWCISVDFMKFYFQFWYQKQSILSIFGVFSVMRLYVKKHLLQCIGGSGKT